MIFSVIERTNPSRKKLAEGDFDFLNRVAGEPFDRVRAAIEEYFQNYPAAGQAELAHRITSGNNEAFTSATFELFVHEYIRRLGMTATPHPVLPNGSTKRPDFLVECVTGERFYLEAVGVTERTDRNKSAEAMKLRALQPLDDETHSQFELMVVSDGDPRSQPSGRRLKNEILYWLKQLDPDQALSAIAVKGEAGIPTTSWQHEGWQLSVWANPIKPDFRHKVRPVIGAYLPGPTSLYGRESIRQAVTRKSSYYGALDLPLVIAVNISSMIYEYDTEAQALFGDTLYAVNVDRATGMELGTERMRKPNGAWEGPQGPQGTKTSAAWMFNNLTPYKLAQGTHYLYLNPWAQKPVPMPLRVVPHVELDGMELVYRQGLRLASLFGLADGWPE